MWTPFAPYDSHWGESSLISPDFFSCPVSLNATCMQSRIAWEFSWGGLRTATVIKFSQWWEKLMCNVWHFHMSDLTRTFQGSLASRQGSYLSSWNRAKFREVKTQQCHPVETWSALSDAIPCQPCEFLSNLQVYLKPMSREGHLLILAGSFPSMCFGLGSRPIPWDRCWLVPVCAKHYSCVHNWEKWLSGTEWETYHLGV